MTMRDRVYLYEEEATAGNIELDFLSRSFVDMNLRTRESFRISGVMKFRPDLISRKAYGTPHLGWLIARHNKFLDPIQDFYDGRLINIPDLDAYFRYFRVNARSE